MLLLALLLVGSCVNDTLGALTSNAPNRPTGNASSCVSYLMHTYDGDTCFASNHGPGICERTPAPLFSVANKRFRAGMYTTHLFVVGFFLVYVKGTASIMNEWRLQRERDCLAHRSLEHPASRAYLSERLKQLRADQQSDALRPVHIDETWFAA